MKYILLFTTLIFAGEMELDGNLKVNGNIDANGNVITNVGAPQNLTDAVNAGILASALSDDGVYEYSYIRMKFNYGMFSGTGSYFTTSYMELGQESWTSDFLGRLNQLMLDGWIVSHRFGFGSPQSAETYVAIYELRRPLSDD